MLTTLLAFALLTIPTQASDRPTVGRLHVNTPHETNIIYMYAGAAFPEGASLKVGAVECFVSELKATGLFTDVHVTLKPSKGGQIVDVVIEPTWHSRKDHFIISEVVLEDLTGIDEQKLRANLLQKGVMAGMPLSKVPLPLIGEAVGETIRELYQADPDKEGDVSDELFYVSLKIKLAGVERVKLVVAPSSKRLCTQ